MVRGCFRGIVLWCCVARGVGIRWCIGERCGDLGDPPPLPLDGEDPFRPCCRSCEAVENCTNSRNEEVHVVKYLLPHLANPSGIFVEIGGNDGIRESNTLYVENCLGWRGVMIEAHPVHYQKMIANRPRVTGIHAAACEKNETVNFQKRPAPGSHIVAATADHIQVPCIPLSDVFEKLNISNIAFFSLDVEGAESKVLHGIDFEKVTIAVLVMEELGKTSPHHRADARRILETNANLRLAFTHCWMRHICDSYWYNPALLPTFDFTHTFANVPNVTNRQLPKSSRRMHRDTQCRAHPPTPASETLRHST